jgi:hypothetical protein
MDSAYLSAVAALAGSAIGGFTSLAASWLTQRVQVTAERLAHELSRREELYRDFMDDASAAFADALERSEVDVAKLVRLYALISRMRVVASERVVEQADGVMRTIMETYRAPNRSLREVAEVAEPSALDPLRAFSDACRAERRQVVAGSVFRETTGRGGYEKRPGVTYRSEPSSVVALRPDRQNTDSRLPRLGRWSANRVES